MRSLPDNELPAGSSRANLNESPIRFEDLSMAEFGSETSTISKQARLQSLSKLSNLNDKRKTNGLSGPFTKKRYQFDQKLISEEDQPVEVRRSAMSYLPQAPTHAGVPKDQTNSGLPTSNNYSGKHVHHSRLP